MLLANQIAALRNPSRFEGRASRKEYWARFFKWYILNLVLCSAFIGISLLVQGGGTFDEDTPAFLGMLVVMGCISAFYMAPVSARRLHDLGLPSTYLVWMARNLTVPVAFLALLGMVLFIAKYVGLAVFVWAAGLILYFPLHLAMTLAILAACFGSQPGPNRFGPNPNEVSP
jgi:uncharacterized membrane protein YhaH (DUF805 family)